MDLQTENGNFLAQLDAAEVEAFDALLLLGKTCSVRFTTDTNETPSLKKDPTDSSAGSGQYHFPEEDHIYDEDDEEEESDDIDDDDDLDDDDNDDDSAEHTHDSAEQLTPNDGNHQDDPAHSAAMNNHMRAANKRKLKRCKRQRRKRRRSLAWDRGHIADSCKEAMRRVRAYLHTQRHTPLPSYVVPISDVHSFFGIMYMNILNLGDLKLVHRFFEHFATSRVCLYTYDRVDQCTSSTSSSTDINDTLSPISTTTTNKVEKAKNVWKVKGGDLIALYFAYYFETSPDIVAKLKECHIIPVPPELNAQLHHHPHPHPHHGHTTAAQGHTATHLSMPLPLPSPRHNDTTSTTAASLTTVSPPVSSTVSSTVSPPSPNLNSSSTPFALNDYICCVQLDLRFQGTRLFENDVNAFKAIIDRDNGLQTPQQRQVWSQGRIEDYFAQALQPLQPPVSYSFDSCVRMYVNCRRKVDRIEVVRSFHNGWL